MKSRLFVRWALAAGSAALLLPTRHDAARAQSAARVTWFAFSPAVVGVFEPEDVRLEVQAVGATAITLALSDSTRVPLTDHGSGRFGVTLTSRQILFGYAADEDVMRNFVGRLELTPEGGAAPNLFIGVADGSFPVVPVRMIDPDLQASPRVANVLAAFEDPSAVQPAAVAQRFYADFGDDYDFLNVLTVPEYFGNRHHLHVRNAVQGIGVSILDRGESYGSRQRLLGVNRFPILTYFDAAERGALHETGHQWIAFVDLPALQSGVPHWPISSLAYGIMGFRLPGGAGGDLPFRIDVIGGGEGRFEGAERSALFTDMDLYLMGLLPPEEVRPHVVLQEQGRQQCHRCPTGPLASVTVDDVIRRHGPRVPDHRTAPRDFRVATIVVSRRLLTAREMSYIDHFAARGEAREPLPYTSGLARGTTLPWHLATGRRSTLTMTLE